MSTLAISVCVGLFGAALMGLLLNYLDTGNFFKILPGHKLRLFAAMVFIGLVYGGFVYVLLNLA